jgi:hypothetical protein
MQIDPGTCSGCITRYSEVVPQGLAATIPRGTEGDRFPPDGVVATCASTLAKGAGASTLLAISRLVLSGKVRTKTHFTDQRANGTILPPAAYLDQGWKSSCKNTFKIGSLSGNKTRSHFRLSTAPSPPTSKPPAKLTSAAFCSR